MLLLLPLTPMNEKGKKRLRTMGRIRMPAFGYLELTGDPGIDMPASSLLLSFCLFFSTSCSWVFLVPRLLCVCARGECEGECVRGGGCGTGSCLSSYVPSFISFLPLILYILRYYYSFISSCALILFFSLSSFSSRSSPVLLVSSLAPDSADRTLSSSPSSCDQLIRIPTAVPARQRLAQCITRASP